MEDLKERIDSYLDDLKERMLIEEELIQAIDSDTWKLLVLDFLEDHALFEMKLAEHIQENQVILDTVHDLGYDFIPAYNGVK